MSSDDQAKPTQQINNYDLKINQINSYKLEINLNTKINIKI